MYTITKMIFQVALIFDDKQFYLCTHTCAFQGIKVIRTGEHSMWVNVIVVTSNNCAFNDWNICWSVLSLEMSLTSGYSVSYTLSYHILLFFMLLIKSIVTDIGHWIWFVILLSDLIKRNTDFEVWRTILQK